MTAAKVKIPLWKSAFLWNKVADVLTLLGTGGLITVDVNNSDQKWTWIIGVATALVQIIRMLFADTNKNNVVDLFETQEADIEQEINISVRSNPEPGGSPIVDVTQTTTEKKE